MHKIKGPNSRGCEEKDENGIFENVIFCTHNVVLILREVNSEKVTSL
jgi:hypothetical protein